MPSVFAFEAIGTHWQVDVTDDLSPQQEGSLLQLIKERIAEFDLTYSRFRPDSIVSRISRDAGTYTLPPDAQQLFAMYRKMYELTHGAVTPLIGQVLVDAGYDSEYSLRSKKLTTPPAWDTVMSFMPPTLTTRQPIQLDFGAAGKGYLIDLVGEVIRALGIAAYCIDAGGDILHRDATGTKLRVGLENPSNTQQVLGVATISNQSICGSAGNRRAWENFHHIISPHTLTSPKNILAVWAIAESTLLADALTTCLFFAPAEDLLREFRFEYLIVNDDFSVEASPKFPAELFT